MKKQKLYKLLNNVDIIQLKGNEQIDIMSICSDSRKTECGSLFIAQKGLEYDGHNYINSAIETGAVAIILEQMPETLCDNITYVQVNSSSDALVEIAKNFYEDPTSRLKLIGITGTNGKTTTVTLSYNLFSDLGYKCGLISTIVNKIADKEIPTDHTTPDIITLNELLFRMAEKKCEYVFMEVSSHAIVQNRIGGLKYYGAIFSNITHDHLDYHKTFENYIKAKKTFFDNLDKTAFALTNVDDKNGLKMLEASRAQKYTYSLTKEADFKAKIIEKSFEGMLLKINGKEVYSQLTGRFNAYNVLCVYSIAYLCGLNQDNILLGISKLKAAEGRFEVMKLKNEATAIVDYAHTPDALENVISTINDIRPNGHLIIVVGCGGNRDKSKRPEMAHIAQKGSDILILTSDNPRNEDPDIIIEEMKQGITENEGLFCISNRKEAIKLAAQLSRGKQDVILIAGKGHETYQEIKGVKHHFDDKEEISKY